MIDLLNYIVWQPDLEAFHLGPISVRWYGLMWIIGLAMAYLVVRRLYKEQQILVWTDVDHWSGAGLSGGTASL